MLTFKLYFNIDELRIGPGRLGPIFLLFFLELVVCNVFHPTYNQSEGLTWLLGQDH